MKKNEVIVASLLGVITVSAAVVGYVKRKFIKRKVRQVCNRLFRRSEPAAYIPEPDPAPDPTPKTDPAPAPTPDPAPTTDDAVAETLASGSASTHAPKTSAPEDPKPTDPPKPEDAPTA